MGSPGLRWVGDSYAPEPNLGRVELGELAEGVELGEAARGVFLHNFANFSVCFQSQVVASFTFGRVLRRGPNHRRKRPAYTAACGSAELRFERAPLFRPPLVRGPLFRSSVIRKRPFRPRTMSVNH